MKRNNYYKIILFFAGLLIGSFLITQYRHDGFKYYFVSLNAVQEIQDSIISTNDEIANLRNLISEKQKELLRVQDAVNDGNVVKILKEEIENVKNVAGMTNLRGSGIMIRISDGTRHDKDDDISNYVVHDSDILNIINDLKAAGAEAISIKGQRVLSTSEIHCGGPVIWINKRSVSNPFVINVIGNPKQLYAAINAPGTNGDLLKKYINIDTKISDNIFIPRFYEDIDFIYAKPIKEGDD